MKARSAAEIEVWFRHHGCGRCGQIMEEREFDLVRSQEPSGQRLRTYSATCTGCGQPREVRIEVPGTWEPMSGTAIGGDDPSRMFPPDELLGLTDRLREGVAAEPATLDPETFFAANGRLAVALRFAEELRKFVPPGADRVPESAFFGPTGAADLRARPADYLAAAIDQRVDTIRRLRERYGKLLSAMNQSGKGTGNPASGKVTALSRDLLEAHKQWLGRGRTGAGRVVLDDANLAGMKLGSIKLGGARLVRADMSGATMDFSNFAGAELVECLAERTNFAHSVFDEAMLQGCRFERADLGLCDLVDTTIEGGSFRGAHADRGKWQRVKAHRVDLREVRFGDAILDGSQFEDCDLRDANLSHITAALRDITTTFNATFRRCDLRGASFEGRKLDGTRFIDCKMAGIVGKPVLTGSYVVERPDFSTAGDGSDVRAAAAVHALWGKR